MLAHAQVVLNSRTPARRTKWSACSSRNVTETHAGHTGAGSACWEGASASGMRRAARTMAVTAVARGTRPRWWSGMAAWTLWALTMLGLPVVAWLDHLLRQAGSSELPYLQAANAPEVVAAVSAATVGALLASRRPAHPVGWLLLGLGLSVPLSGIVEGYVRYGLVARPGALPAAAYLAGISNGGIGLLVLACGGFVLLLTPTGSLPSPRWRWWARVAAAAPVVFLVSSALDPQPLLPEYPMVGNPLAVPSALTGPLRDLGAVAGITLLAAL